MMTIPPMTRTMTSPVSVTMMTTASSSPAATTMTILPMTRTSSSPVPAMMTTTSRI